MEIKTKVQYNDWRTQETKYMEVSHTEHRDKPDSEYITNSSYGHINAWISEIVENHTKLGVNGKKKLHTKTIAYLRIWLETYFKEEKISGRPRGTGRRPFYIVTPSAIGASVYVKIGSLSFNLSEFEYSS